jgi:hypothetical protein
MHHVASVVVADLTDEVGALLERELDVELRELDLRPELVVALRFLEPASVVRRPERLDELPLMLVLVAVANDAAMAAEARLPVVDALALRIALFQQPTASFSVVGMSTTPRMSMVTA